ncbi:hypothetical protein ACP4OV_029421 [Aristida adscensionis]
MASPKSRNTRALILAAIMVVAMILSPCHAQENCFGLAGCSDVSCTRYCETQGYVNPVVHCRKAPPGQLFDTCCCYVKCCGKSD